MKILFLALLSSAAPAFADQTLCPDYSPLNFPTDTFGEMSSMARTFRSVGRSPSAELIDEAGTRLARLNRPECKGKVWPSHDILKNPVRYLDSDAKTVMQFNPTSGRFEKLRPMNAADERIGSFDFQKNTDGGIIVNPRVALPPPPRNPGGGGGPPGGGPPPDRPQLPCGPEDQALQKFYVDNPGLRGATAREPVDVLLTFTAHENFHNVDQDPGNPAHKHPGSCQWHSKGSTDRTFPGDKESIKLMRQNIMASLKAALEAENPTAKKAALANARGWMQKLRAEHGDAMKKLVEVDRAEGTAEYAGVMTNLYGKYGCGAAPSAMRQDILKYLKDRYMPEPQDVAQQSYLLGSASGLLLDEMGVKDWKERVAKGETPLDLLMGAPGMPPPAPRPASDPLLAITGPLARNFATCMQNAADDLAKHLKTNADEYVLVQLEDKPMGFLGTPTQTSAAGADTIISHASTMKGESFSFEHAQTLAMKNLCGGGKSPEERYVVVHRSQIDANGKVGPREGSKVKMTGQLPPSSAPRRDWNGVPVLCR